MKYVNGDCRSERNELNPRGAGLFAPKSLANQTSRIRENEHFFGKLVRFNSFIRGGELQHRCKIPFNPFKLLYELPKVMISDRNGAAFCLSLAAKRRTSIFSLLFLKSFRSCFYH